MKIALFISLFFSFLIGGNYSDAVKVKKLYPMGKRIHTARCASFDAKQFDTYEALLDALAQQQVCGQLSYKHTEALAIYLWDHKEDAKEQHFEKIVVDKEEKCPVCGMYLYKYPQWVSKLSFQGKSYYFDGIKDMMKFYFTHNVSADATLRVQEYYTHKTLDAKKSYFVIGSDVYGPMGDELIAFENKEKAQQFLLDHRGKKVISFTQITQEMVYSLDQ